jgi:hypothetical protein
VTDKIKTALIGQFEGKAGLQVLDGQNVTAVWTDGVMLSADNGSTKLMPGKAPCAFNLAAGDQYAVVVSRVVADGEAITDAMLSDARKAFDDAVDNYNALLAAYALQNCPFKVGQLVDAQCFGRYQECPAVIESVHGAHYHSGRFGWFVRVRLLTRTGKERKNKETAKYSDSDFTDWQELKRKQVS